MSGWEGKDEWLHGFIHAVVPIVLLSSIIHSLNLQGLSLTVTRGCSL